jgi:aminoglycoside phosphotransferase (APT) family kinase protein
MAFSVSEVARYLTSLTMAAGDDPYPVLALVGRWLEQHAPNASRRAVVHGDFRIGNILYDASGLTAVLDWELAHVGDPLEDVGWLCVRAWRFGNDEMPVGGLCSREQFWELYEGESGVVVDPAAALYWELFGNWKWAIICVIQAASFRKGRYPNLELASLGRRVGEVEWELLSLLEAAERGLVTGTNRKGGQGDVA